MGFLGVTWRVFDNWVFWPGIYLNVLKNHKDFPENEELSNSDDGLIGKITFPIEYRFTDYATGTLNPTLEFPGGPFGGMNAQFVIFF